MSEEIKQPETVEVPSDLPVTVTVGWLFNIRNLIGKLPHDEVKGTCQYLDEALVKVAQEFNKVK